MRVIRLEVDELEGSVEYEEDYAEELADVIIASLSVAGKLGIDIDAAVRRKMEINKARPWKHGKETECNT
ncbi:MAG: MazG-like family protein [Candidatus Ventricola sp.]|nr:MazG-like family protein [Candidatus Ventricola sp.]